MSAAGRCIHPDCIYRNRGDPDRTGNCNYFSMTGTCRISGLKPPQQEPENCPRYVPDGTTPPVPGNDWKPEATRLYLAGATDREIAEAVGVKYDTVQHWRYNTLKRPANPSVKGPAAKFDWEKAQELYRHGKNDQEIAHELGCSPSSVWRWRTKYELFPNAKRRKKEEMA